jgi:hypothetical protein
MTSCVAIDPTDIANPPKPKQDAGGNTTALSYSISVFGASVTWSDGDEIIFTSCSMVDGAGYEWSTGAKGALTKKPNPAGGTMTGNSGHGYARITLSP